MKRIKRKVYKRNHLLYKDSLKKRIKLKELKKNLIIFLFFQKTNRIKKRTLFDLML